MLKTSPLSSSTRPETPGIKLIERSSITSPRGRGVLQPIVWVRGAGCHFLPKPSWPFFFSHEWSLTRGLSWGSCFILSHILIEPTLPKLDFLQSPHHTLQGVPMSRKSSGCLAVTPPCHLYSMTRKSSGCLAVTPPCHLYRCFNVHRALLHSSPMGPEFLWLLSLFSSWS